MRTELMEPREEFTLTTQRLRWGIFIPAVQVMIALAVMSLPELFFLRFTANMFGGLNPQAPSSFLRMLLRYLFTPLTSNQSVSVFP